MKNIQIIIVLLLFSCSGSKEFDETPTPVGGDNAVRSAFQQYLGSAYSDVAGSSVGFTIRINEEGTIEEVSMNRRTDNERINKTLPFILKDQIRFIPATKNGKKAPALFGYTLTL
jgi:hypothetical protein